MSIVLRGEIYHAKIWNKETGKFDWETLGTGDINEAHVLYGEKLKKLRTNEPELISVSWDSFAKEYIDDYSKINRAGSWKTDQAALRNFERFSKILDLKLVNTKLIEKWKSHLKARGGTPQSINSYLARLYNALSQAVTWGYLEKNPAEGVNYIQVPETQKRAFTRLEIDTIRASADSLLQEVFVELAFLTGGRRKEMRNLQFADFDFNLNRIKIGPSKNGEIRYVPLHEKLKKLILKWMKAVPGPYVLSLSGKATSIRNFSRRFSAILKRAKVKGSLHICRHTYITYLLTSGVKPILVQQWAGHKHFSTTEKYYKHVMAGEGQEEITLLNI